MNGGHDFFASGAKLEKEGRLGEGVNNAGSFFVSGLVDLMGNGLESEAAFSEAELRAREEDCGDDGGGEENDAGDWG